jgi:hypothetical protein
MKGNFALIVCLVGLSLSSRAAELKQKTSTAFDNYVAATEARINSELRPGGIFLYVDALQTDTMKSSYEKLMNGEVLVEKRETKGPGLSSDVPDGMVHHWIGIIFIPGVTLAQLLPIVQGEVKAMRRYSLSLGAGRCLRSLPRFAFRPAQPRNPNTQFPPWQSMYRFPAPKRWALKRAAPVTQTSPRTSAMPFMPNRG